MCSLVQRFMLYKNVLTKSPCTDSLEEVVSFLVRSLLLPHFPWSLTYVSDTGLKVNQRRGALATQTQFCPQDLPPSLGWSDVFAAR